MKKFLKENWTFILLLLLALFIRQTKIFAINIIQGDSMLPTYKSHQIVLGTSLTQKDRGDIIVARHEGSLVIKRLIGLPGDTIAQKNGNIYINGKLLDEPYIEEGRNEHSRLIEWEYVLGDDEYFYMGDNRDNSYDCRAYGPVNKSNILEEVINF